MATIELDENVEMKPSAMMKEALAASGDIHSMLEGIANVGKVTAVDQLRHIKDLVYQLEDALDDLIIDVQ